MKTIHINVEAFFETLKLKDTSMWEIFSQMIDGEEKLLLFMEDEEKVLFSYTLPSSLEQLEEERKTFSKEFANKVSNFN